MDSSGLQYTVVHCMGTGNGVASCISSSVTSRVLPLTLSPFLLLSLPLLLPLPLTSSLQVSPDDHPAGNFEFDVLIGADGRRSTIPGFDRKELRGKLALAITANFINYFTREEAGVEEISGVAFIFNQKFFKVRCVVSVRGWVGEGVVELWDGVDVLAWCRQW